MHTQCVYECNPSTASKGKAALPDLREVVVASELPLVPSKQLFAISTTRSLPSVVNVHSSF